MIITSDATVLSKTKNITTIALLALVSPGAYASSGGLDALAAIIFIQAVMFAWPFLLAMVYTRKADNKLASFLVFLLVTLGVTSLVGIPSNILYQLAPWFGMEHLYKYSMVVSAAVQVIALIAAIITLKKYRQCIANVLAKTTE